MTKDLLKKLIDEYQGEDLADYISGQLTAMEKTRTEIRRIEIRKRKAEEEYQQTMREFGKDLEAVQRNCRHLESSYVGSYHSCEICGKTW